MQNVCNRVAEYARFVKERTASLSNVGLITLLNSRTCESGGMHSRDYGGYGIMARIVALIFMVVGKFGSLGLLIIGILDSSFLFMPFGWKQPPF